MHIPVKADAELRFEGRVLPESWRITTGHPRVVRWRLADSDAVAEFTVLIANSMVSVECTLSGEFQLGDIYRRALDMAQTMVDIISFAKGLSLTVVFDKVTHDGNESNLAVYSPGVENFCTAYNIETGFDDILKLALDEPTLYIALNDLNVALGHLTHMSRWRPGDPKSKLTGRQTWRVGRATHLEGHSIIN